ncbi:MAG: ABC transporter ATP-binding protein [Patescibacteria group bacterium]
METIIEVKNIGKKYNINHQRGGYVALRDVLANVFKNPFNFLKNKTREIIGIDKKEEFWALKNVDFEVRRGEVVGIIGRNGAGKSTLLKILSQITPPTTGEIKINGKVGSLLEVGTGFHPELTGRENIFLNGAILGMKKKEIINKFDEIVEFANIEKFLDTPVKYYSSGMYVRLAFSVAAHMEPDILIIDEVLAVGDSEFQKKCLGKMEDITKKEGRTILFVSHNMSTIKQLCTRSILLSKGNVKMVGNTDEVVDFYLNDKTNTKENAQEIPLDAVLGKSGVRFTHIKISNDEGNSNFESGDKLKIELDYESDLVEEIKEVRVVISILNKRSQQIVLRLDSDIPNQTISENMPTKGKILCETESMNLGEGSYVLDVDFLIGGTSVNYVRGLGQFEVETNLEKYDFKKYPDVSVCDTVIGYQFK